MVPTKSYLLWKGYFFIRIGDYNCQKCPYSFHILKVIILLLCHVYSYQSLLFIRKQWSLHSSGYFNTSNVFLNFTFLEFNSIKIGLLKAYSFGIINLKCYWFSSFYSLILWWRAVIHFYMDFSICLEAFPPNLHRTIPCLEKELCSAEPECEASLPVNEHRCFHWLTVCKVQLSLKINCYHRPHRMTMQSVYWWRQQPIGVWPPTWSYLQIHSSLSNVLV